MLSDLPVNTGLNDLISFFKIFVPSELFNITSNFSLYFAFQFPKSHLILFEINLHLLSKSIGSIFFGILSVNLISLSS